MVCTAASISRTIKGHSAEAYLRSVFPKLEFLRSEQFLKISDRIQHGIVEVEGVDTDERLGLLKQLIETAEENHFVVFCRRNESVMEVAEYLEAQGIPALPFHSDLSDKQKVENMFKFRSGKYAVFVCGDSANRGIHFDFDPHVVQFESAQNAVCLLHRFGRTGRLGRKGRVTSFLEKGDYDLMSRFQELMDGSENITPIVSRNRGFAKKMRRQSKGREQEGEQPQ